MATASARKKYLARKRAAKLSPAPDSAWPLRRTAGVRILEAPALRSLDWLVHGFSTRAHKDRKKFFRAIGAAAMRVVILRQIHSDMAHVVNSSIAPDGEPPQGDALLTREPGILLAVQTADCVPILLADPKNRAIAAIHSGWRGTLRRLAAKALGRMHMEFGTRSEDIIAALGASIGRCCYEVGPEVAREFHGQFADAAQFFDGPFAAVAAGENDPSWLPWLSMAPPGHAPPKPRICLDLIAANRAILIEAGASPENIFASGYCTACRTDLFFSHRREQSTGRMLAAIALR